MIPLLVWVAGCVFCGYVIFHFGMYREALAFVVCMGSFLWVVGGASWIGQKLQAGVAARAANAANGPTAPGIVLTEKDREALKRAAAQQRSEQSS